MLDEHIIPFPVSIDLTEELALQEKRALARVVRYEVSIILSGFAGRLKLPTVPEVRVTETGIIVYSQEFQAIRFGGLCGMVSELTIRTAHDIRYACQRAGITFEYGGAVAPEEVEVPARTCKARPTGFRSPPEPTPLAEEIRLLA